MPHDLYGAGREHCPMDPMLKLWDTSSLRTLDELTGESDASMTVDWDSFLHWDWQHFSLDGFLFLHKNKLVTFPLNDDFILFDFVSSPDPCALPALSQTWTKLDFLNNCSTFNDVFFWIRFFWLSDVDNSIRLYI